MSKKIAYTLTTVITLTVMGIAISLLLPNISKSEHGYGSMLSIVIFYSTLNSISFKLHDNIAKQNKAFLTRYYLLDKSIRFISSIIFISILLFVSNLTEIAIIAFAYYIIAMIIEISYFVAMDKKTETKNA